MLVRLQLGTGVGIVVANMIGAGVFISAGFMAQDMGPGHLLLAWVVGAAIALCGTRAYATVARLCPRSGGEYRYLSDLFHPALGYLAGWATLLVGFSAPVAIDALAAAAFTGKLLPVGEPRLLAAGLVVVLTALHALDLRVSLLTQDWLFMVKAVLVMGFVAVGLFFGHNAWPTWTPPHASPGFPLEPFMGSLFFIAFAFSGWNAAIYSAEEFENPSRDVPRAMAIGCALVAVLYLAVNWVFVANLTPERAQVVFTYDQQQVTLGHLILEDMIGPAGARIMSGFVVVAFLSAMSAMTFAGPRVYAAMARDGYLPRVLIGRDGRPPTGSIVLQGVLAIVLLQAQQLREILSNVGAILTLFAALTAASLFKVKLTRKDADVPPLSLLAAGVYVLAAGWMLYFGLRGKTQLALWLAVVAAVTVVAWLVTRALKKAPV